mmetsp:Transcript_19692/g.45948  ORF Transcript_19692/g.45948 Transcript_19692/m.45948 type:complete len:88 (+) Transcript_19692:3-266(+)
MVGDADSSRSPEWFGSCPASLTSRNMFSSKSKKIPQRPHPSAADSSDAQEREGGMPESGAWMAQGCAGLLLENLLAVATQGWLELAV